MTQEQDQQMQARTVTVGDSTVQAVSWSNSLPLALIAGTCALEGRETTMRTAEAVTKTCAALGIPVIYKGSFDKANRTSTSTARGMGLEDGLALLAEVRKEFGVPVLTDVHDVAQVAPVTAVVDVVQIPAFLSRQTDLLVACGREVAKYTNKAVNVKKGQFMAPADMLPAARKLEQAGTENILLTERGTTFGYGNLVVDYRSFGVMAGSGYPVVHDASHSVMMPSVHGDSSGGDRRYIPALSRAAVAAGVAGIFLETHPDPAAAISDRETQWPLDQLRALLEQLVTLDRVVKRAAMDQAVAA